jgi:tetratricopeptide (TPR) repeat protein
MVAIFGITLLNESANNMKHLKSILLFSFGFILSSGAIWASPNNNRIDSLKKVLSTQNDLSLEKRGEILSGISKSYLQMGDVKNAKAYNWKSLEIFRQLKNHKSTAKVLLDLGINEFEMSRYDEAIRFYFEAEEVLKIGEHQLSENIYKLYHGMILMNIGIIYQETKNYSQALTYFHESLDNLIDAKADSSYMATCYTNLGTTYGALEQFDLVKKYCEKALAYYGGSEIEEYYKTIVYTNLGNAYILKKDYEKALEYYNQSLEFYKNQDRFSKSYAAILASISDVYMDLNKLDKAKNYLDRAISVSVTGEDSLYMEHIYQTNVKYYTKINNPLLALENMKILNKIKENNYHPEVIANIASYQKDFALKKIEKENELKVISLEREQLLETYKWYGFGCVCIVLLLIASFFVYRQKNKIKLKNLALENYKIEQEQFTEKLKFKNNQLTNYAMYIVKKNEFLEEIKGEIDTIKSVSDDKESITPLSTLINQHINNSKDRKDFEIRIEKENQDFYFKLQKNFPTLNENDKKLCSLLLLELSSKEMAAILNISVGSVEKSRHRLRKKLAVDSEISLSKFLNNL